MIKDIEKDNENVAINDKAIAVLREHFPACFKSDGSFDIERFKEELKDKVGAKEFFKQLTIDGYTVEFHEQINNKKIKQIVDEVLQ
jgi:type III restriction enzyme/adenine-specific DNA-methyltransferase